MALVVDGAARLRLGVVMEATMDATELRIRDYEKALDQSQRYLALALAGVVALWLLRAPGDPTKPCSVTLFGVGVDAPMARVLFFATHIVTGALALYALEAAKRLVAPLASIPEFAEVLREYPSVAASPWPGVRVAVPLLSMILLAWTFLSWVGAPVGVARISVWWIILSLAVHVPLLLVLWMPPIGPWTIAPTRGLWS
jgi:hypothetical protein